MISKVFPLLKLEQTCNNPNAEYGIDEAVQRNMANGNTQFAIDLARKMGISYSIPTIALQIVARFFHIRCYINYDRFMIIVACMLLAFKLRYMEFKMKDVVFGFYQVVCARNHYLQPYDEKLYLRIREEVVIAENQVLRTLQYDIDVTTPHDSLPQIFGLSLIDPQKVNKIKLTTRTIILDSNRLQTSLYFSPLITSIACFLVACRYQNEKPYGIKANANKQTGGSEIREQKTEQQMYGEWLESIGEAYKQKIKQQDILECIKYLNKLIKIMLITET